MRFNLALIFSGLLFFFNPTFQMLDVLPDFIGAVLIMFGLSKMYMYNADFDEARKSAKFLLWFSVIKFALCLWTNSGNKDYIMPFTFFMCVLEIIYSIALFKSLYKGIEYTLMRSNLEKHVKHVNEAFTMSFIFVIGAKLLEFAPHITDIFAQDEEFDLSAGASFKMSMAQMKVYVYFVSLVLGLLLGLVYVFVISKTWIKLIGDRQYCSYLNDKYLEYAELDRTAFIEEKIRKIYFLFSLSFVFFIDFYIEGINIFPSPVGHLLLICTLLYLSKHSNAKKGLVLSVGIPAVVMSCINYVYMNRVWLGTYYNTNQSYNKEVFPFLESKGSVIAAGLLSFAEAALAIALMIMCLAAMKPLFEKEKRSVAVPMLKFSGLFACAAFVAPTIRNVLLTLEGHLSTDVRVGIFADSLDKVTAASIEKMCMEYPKINLYYNLITTKPLVALGTALLCIIAILYMLRMMSFTDGERK